MNDGERIGERRQWAYDDVSLIIQGLSGMDQSLFGESQRQVYAEVFSTAHLEMVKMDRDPNYIPTNDVINWLRDRKIQLTNFIWKKHEIQ